MSGAVELEGEKRPRRWRSSALRRKVGMVFALPLPLPLSIFENVAYGLRMHGLRGGERLCRARGGGAAERLSLG